MFNHLNESPTKPKRVVILGAKGFVGSTAYNRIRDILPVVTISREQIDLCNSNAAEQLAKVLQPDDALLITSAKAPCKNHTMLLENIQMMNSVCDALVKQPVQHVLYISSDAVYADSMGKLNESSPAAPTSLHGAMHVAREQMLQSVVNKQSLAILRPSLLYGTNDPHNGYGPNSFYRLAQAEKSIELFGQGEEQRDHVYIEDVAELIYLSLMHRSYGILNITTGTTASFYEIAELINQYTNNSAEIKCKTRNGPMPHNGYRAFDNSVCHKAFPAFQYNSITDGLKKIHQLSLRKEVGAAHA